MENSKNKLRLGLAVLVVFCVFSSVLIAGELEPSAPPSSGGTMKTLDEVEPRIPIHEKDLPLYITEPGSYYFAENLDFGKELLAAIVINTGDVTIDLCGFTLTGHNKCDYGIYCQEQNNVKVRNGVVTYFKNNGIHMPGDSHVVEDIRIKGTAVGIYLGDACRVNNCTVMYPTSIGIRVFDSCIVSNCVVREDLTPQCSTGIMCGEHANVFNCNVYSTLNKGIIAFCYASVKNCTVAKTEDAGVYSGSGSVISGCSIYNCGKGIRAEYDGYIHHNNVYQCIDEAISLGYNTKVKDNKIEAGHKGIVGLYHNMLISNVINHTATAVEVQGNNLIEGNIIDECSTGLDMIKDDNLYLNNRLHTTFSDYANETDDNDGGGNLSY